MGRLNNTTTHAQQVTYHRQPTRITIRTSILNAIKALDRPRHPKEITGNAALTLGHRQTTRSACALCELYVLNTGDRRNSDINRIEKCRFRALGKDAEAVDKAMARHLEQVPHYDRPVP